MIHCRKIVTLPFLEPSQIPHIIFVRKMEVWNHFFLHSITVDEFIERLRSTQI